MEPEPEMQESVDYEDPELLVKLIQSNDLKDKELLKTIVMKIINEQNRPLFDLLLAYDYAIEVLNEEGQTALHYAFYYSYNDFIRRFLNKEQLKSDGCDYTDSNGLSHLHIACAKHENFLELIKTYVRNGANINAWYHSDRIGFYSQCTPLHCAMGHRNYDIIQFLLENGANVNVADSIGRTALHLACRWNNFKGMVQIVELLINKFNANMEARDQLGDTPLLSMFDYPNATPLVRLPVRDVQPKFDVLLKNGANIMAKNIKGDTALHLVIKTLSLEFRDVYLPTSSSYDNHHHAKFVKQILDFDNQFIDARNIEGKTPLQLAVSMTNADIVKILLDHGADVSLIKLDCGDEQIFCYPGIVPQFETVNNIMTIVNLIIDKGFELNLKDHLIILQFLAHGYDDCDCSVFANDLEENMLTRTTALLNCGTTQHAKQILSQLRENNTNDFLSITYDLWVYLKMMKNGNFYLDGEIEEILTALTLLHHGENVDLHEKELLHLKTNIKLKNGMMLYNLMTKHPYTAPPLLTEDNFDYKLIDDFKEYKDIIKGHVTKAIVRNYIVKSAYDYLPLTPLSSLPVLCIDMILSFLSNADIYMLCSTVFVPDFRGAVQNV